MWPEHIMNHNASQGMQSQALLLALMPQSSYTPIEISAEDWSTPDT